MKSITLSADEQHIESAIARAHAEQTTLEDVFRIWLADYAQHGDRMRHYDETMAELRGQMSVGRKLTREEMNER